MIIKTERLIIREFNDADIDLIYEINNDPECIRFNGWDTMSLEECRKFLNKWIGQYSISPGTGVYCVESNGDTMKIGMAFIVETRTAKEFEIGFRLRSLQWNKGYAKEITHGLQNYARKRLQAKAIVAEVYAENTRSRNVFEKLNFDKLKHPDGDSGLIYRYELR